MMAPISRDGKSPPGRRIRTAIMAMASTTSVRPITCSLKILALFRVPSSDRSPSKAPVTMKVPTTAPVTVLAPPITSMPRITKVSRR